jgi:type II secretory pathway pseudopilin PulG
MTLSDNAESQILALFRMLVVVVIITVLAAGVLYFAHQRQQEATAVALKIRGQLWHERLPLLQQQWGMQHKPARWVVEGYQLHMLPSGWPLITATDDCVVLWKVLLVEDPQLLVTAVIQQAHGCRYETETAILDYDYQQHEIQFFAIKN